MMRDPLGIHHARPIGVMLTGLEPAYASPVRWCEGCGCKLRRQNQGRLCAPCDEAHREPYMPPAMSLHRCQWCSRPYEPEHPNQRTYCSPTCRICARRARDAIRKAKGNTAA